MFLQLLKSFPWLARIMLLLLAAMLLLFFFSCNNGHHGLKAEVCCINTVTQKIEYFSSYDKQETKRLHKTLVQIEGFYRTAFEESALCPSEKEDGSKCFWLGQYPAGTVPDSVLSCFSNKWVIVTARIDTTDKGHLNSYMCSIDSIVCIRER